MNLFKNISLVILLSFAFIYSPKVYTQSIEYKFNHLCVEDGLSQSTIFAIYKDQKNFMWFGTRRGLNRYDGVGFEHYMHNIDDTNSVSSNQIFCIIGDRRDNLIIQTDKSIDYYDRYLDKFFVLPFYERIRNYVQDRNNNIWACSYAGLFKFNDTKLTFDTIENKLLFNGLYDLAIDNNNNLWITNEHGIIHYNIQNKEYIFYDLRDHLQGIRKDFFIVCTETNEVWVSLRNGKFFYYNNEKDTFEAYEQNNELGKLLISNLNTGFENSILAGTDGNGLIVLNSTTHDHEIINHLPDDKYSISSNTIYSIYTDNRQGILWLGSYMGGVDYTTLNSKGFLFYYHEPYNTNSIINSNVRCLFVDNSKKIWIGTRQGISIFNPSDKEILNYSERDLNSYGITNPIITKIWQDPAGYIWICSYKGGTLLYHPPSNKFVDVTKIYPLIKLPENLGIFDILMDSRNNFWFATESGTLLFPENKEGFIFHDGFSKKVIEDRAGRIFIGTVYSGLLSLHLNTLKISSSSFDTLPVSDEMSRVNTLFPDLEGNIWIGTGGGGIIKYNPTNDEASFYTNKDGLPDNNISGIIKDQNGIIWVSTYSGIAKFNEEYNTFKNIYFEEGIQGKEFNPNSIAISDQGIVYVGSINGLLYFDPNNYWENPFIPEVVFTRLFINSDQVKGNLPNPIIDRSVMMNHSFHLNYDQNSIGLEFTAPEYHFGDKVNFYYKIRGIHEDWIDIGDNRFLNFIDLKPGAYNISIKAANCDGYSKADGTSLLIQIDPPPWKTKTAYFLYVLLVITIALIISRIIKARINLKYELILEKAEKDKQTEVNQTRIRFFTDISHEIGNSLTLMNLPLETLKKIEDDDTKKYYLAVINKNAKRLLQLVKRIINLRRIETDNLPLMAEQDDIISFVKTVCKSFNSLAQSRKIKFLQDYSSNAIITWFDKEKLEHILYNLLSNAFKFEPIGGQVSISTFKENGTINKENKKIISISVNNSRSEIPESKAKYIFTRFYKGDERTFGSGIGLSLAKYYVDIHKGEIQFNSSKEEGVTFYVKLPFGESYLHSEEKIKPSKIYELKTTQFIDSENETDISKPSLKEKKDDGKEIILYIEDNMELRKLLRDHLSSQYRFIEANDGEEGIIKAKNMQPDLIITDIKMHNTDGIELCRILKNDLDTSHIPVIILTANEELDEQIESIELGADAYVTKPFSLKYLNLMIRNLIDTREKLKQLYNSKVESNLSSDLVPLSKMDEKFLEKSYRILEEHIDNANFGISEFIDKLNTTRYMLYTKIKALTGYTPNDFIINYRLKKAALILKNKKISDLDLYIQLGFNDVSYFRKCFKKKYGITPNQYVRSNSFIDDTNKA